MEVSLLCSLLYIQNNMLFWFSTFQKSMGVALLDFEVCEPNSTLKLAPLACPCFYCIVAQGLEDRNEPNHIIGTKEYFSFAV
jgi:hypothetical protein